MCGGPASTRTTPALVEKQSHTARQRFDAERFWLDIRAAKDATKPSEREDAYHLRSIELLTFSLAIVGLALATRGVLSPLAMMALSLHVYAKFTILAHHSMHGGFGRSRRGWYALGLYRRIVDWLDWIFPTAWIIEHNKCHHYHLNEDTDPDFVERNTAMLHAWRLPLGAKYALLPMVMVSWKWFYYASNTLKLLHMNLPNVPSKSKLEAPMTLAHVVYNCMRGDQWYLDLAADLAFRVIAPPLLLQFVSIPVAAGALRRSDVFGVPFCVFTLANLVGAELITSVHQFCTIVTNHTGEDLWHFDVPCRADSPEFVLRAVLSSTAYHAGSNLIDFFHGYLNYQTEHHSFPALSPLHYQRLHPRFKSVCALHGVPYTQEPVWKRVRKTADVMTGVAKHKRMSGLAIDQPERWQVDPSKGRAD